MERQSVPAQPFCSREVGVFLPGPVRWSLRSGLPRFFYRLCVASQLDSFEAVSVERALAVKA